MWGGMGSVLGVGEVSGMWEVWGRCGGRCGRVNGVSVEVVGKWEKVCGDVGRC